jgi:hypothetical protein
MAHDRFGGSPVMRDSQSDGLDPRAVAIIEPTERPLIVLADLHNQTAIRKCCVLRCLVDASKRLAISSVLFCCVQAYALRSDDWLSMDRCRYALS